MRCIVNLVEYLKLYSVETHGSLQTSVFVRAIKITDISTIQSQ